MAYSSDEHIIPISFENVIGNSSGGTYPHMYRITQSTLQDVAEVLGDTWKVESRSGVIIETGDVAYTYSNIYFLTNDETDTLFTVVNDRYVGSNSGMVMVMLNKTTTDREQRALTNLQAFDYFKVVSPSYYTKFIGISKSSASFMFSKMIDRFDNMTKKWYMEVGSTSFRGLYDLDRQAILQSPIYPPASVDTRINGDINYIALAPNVIVTDTEEIQSVNTFIALYDITASGASRSININGKEFVHIQCYSTEGLGRPNNYIRVGDKKEE